MKKLNQRGDLELVFYIGIVVVVVLFIIAAVVFNIYKSTHHTRAQFTINKSERVCGNSRNSGCKYLIYTNAGVFQDSDSIINDKFNSSDVYNQLKAGHHYDCDVTGFRIPVWSEYQNIISCKEAKQ